ncbi:hypothetical protein ACIPX0_26465 [Streptomyces sp. NPDC090075]|uniref:hypothetical protein n=1 Tax=Streptomyces sp. NPDC090075 TaxID=3365937 RepID=UPI003814A041
MPIRPGHVEARITTHGWFQTSVERFDQLITEYLPATVEGLRAQLQQIAADDGSDIDYSDLTTVTECLLVLAELRGFATN